MHEALITDLARIGIQKIIAQSSATCSKARSKRCATSVASWASTAGDRRGDAERQPRAADRAAGARRDRRGRVGEPVREQRRRLSSRCRTIWSAPSRAKCARRSARSRPLAWPSRGRSIRPRTIRTSGPFDVFADGCRSAGAPRFDAIVAEFEKASRIDPAYAAPQAASGRHVSDGQSVEHDSAESNGALGKAARARAIELDEGLAEAHAALGGVLLWHDWDWAGAEREINARSRSTRTRSTR
jgi:hypothetical protein